jgi:ribosomal protein L35AE/L33A
MVKEFKINNRKKYFIRSALDSRSTLLGSRRSRKKHQQADNGEIDVKVTNPSEINLILGKQTIYKNRSNKR